MLSISQILQRAVRIREIDGRPDIAYDLFAGTYDLVDDPIRKAGILSEMALCRKHQKKFDEAKILFKKALITYFASNVIVGIARVNRQLSAIALAEGDVDGAM